MHLTSSDHAIEFDPYAWEMIEDPYPTYQLLRDRAPVYHHAQRDFWAVSRYEDVQTVAHDWQTFSSAAGSGLFGELDLLGSGDFLELDPPRHDELRAIARDHFSAKSVKTLEHDVCSEVEPRVDAFVKRGGGDLATELTRPVPAAVIFRLLGLPREDYEQLDAWYEDLVYRTPGDPCLPSRAWDAAEALRGYLDLQLAERERNPGGDLLSTLAQAKADTRLTFEDVCGISLLLFVGGIQTTSDLVSTSLHLLAQHLDERRYLYDNLDLAQFAVEELLRYVSPVQFMFRTATCATRIHETEIPAGGRVLLLLAAANRDDRRFEEADRLLLSRKRQRHVAFGHGIHFCLGAPLARLQARVVLKSVLERMPNYRVSGPIEWNATPGDRGLSRLPVETSGAAVTERTRT